MTNDTIKLTTSQNSEALESRISLSKQSYTFVNKTGALLLSIVLSRKTSFDPTQVATTLRATTLSHTLEPSYPDGYTLSSHKKRVITRDKRSHAKQKRKTKQTHIPNTSYQNRSL